MSTRPETTTRAEVGTMEPRVDQAGGIGELPMSDGDDPVETDRERSRRMRYEQVVSVEAGGTAYIVLHGDMHIRNGHPVYRFEPFPLKQRAADLSRVRRQPNRRLAAEGREVTFTGREEELARLVAWRDDPGHGVSVLLMHGPDGKGKTRLAAQCAADSASHGWTVWAGQRVSDPTAVPVAAPGETGEMLLLIVEYAERWPVDDLQLLLQTPLLRRPQRARVLLVSRPAEVWWPALRHRLGKAGVAVTATIAPASLTAATADRREYSPKRRTVRRYLRRLTWAVAVLWMMSLGSARLCSLVTADVGEQG
jgi:hypothetical protein